MALSRSEGYPPVANDPLLLRAAQARFPILPAEPSFLTEDFSAYQQRVPGVYFWLGIGDTPALHSPSFDFDESVLQTGLRLLYSLL